MQRACAMEGSRARARVVMCSKDSTADKLLQYLETSQIGYHSIISSHYGTKQGSEEKKMLIFSNKINVACVMQWCMQITLHLASKSINCVCKLKQNCCIIIVSPSGRCSS